MKTYSVKQVAELLQTNPETVRRWIRDKKLDATNRSKKEGSVITEDGLQKFLETAPKYMAKVGAGVLAAGAVTPKGLAAVLLGGGMITAGVGKVMQRSQPVDTNIPPEEVVKLLIHEIDALKRSLESRKALIEQATMEIAEIEDRIRQYESALASFIEIRNDKEGKGEQDDE